MPRKHYHAGLPLNQRGFELHDGAPVRGLTRRRFPGVP